MEIIKGDLSHIDHCVEALMRSELGRVYFSSVAKAGMVVLEGIDKGEIYVAVEDGGETLGFIWAIPNGAFHSFPYVHILAVRESYRGRGVGRLLLAHIEQYFAQYVSKIFLIVDDFNSDAYALYVRLGYQKVGCLPDLYKKGVNGFLMMKSLPICKE